MEIQLTDFENAAFTTFITLLTRVILTFDLNLYLPLSRVDANMQRAHGRNAAVKGKFFFRRHMAPLEKGDDGFEEQYTSMFSTAVNGNKGKLHTVYSEDNLRELNNTNSVVDSEDGFPLEGVSQKRRVAPNASGGAEENSYEEMTMAEIMTGKGGTCLFYYVDEGYRFQVNISCDEYPNISLVSHGRLLPWPNTSGVRLS